MIAKRFKAIGGGLIATIETDNFWIKISTAKEGLFKKPSTLILVPDPFAPFGLRAVAKLIYTSCLSSKDCYQIHDTVCDIVDEGGKTLDLDSVIQELFYTLREKGVVAETINLLA